MVYGSPGSIVFAILTQCFFEQPILSYAEYDHNIESGRHGADREVLEEGGLMLWTSSK